MANEKTGSYRTKRVFVNNIDTYSSKCIAKFLSTCMVGGSLEEADEDGPAEDETTLQDGTFQIVGTISNNEGEKPSFALQCYASQKRDQLLPSLLECDVVVYNISEHATAELIDEATWAISALHSDIESFASQKIFILISSVMTWAMSKPADPNDPEIPLTEDDYRRKRHHPNFKEHANAEKTVLKLGKTKKSKLSSYVVAAGVQYGMGENLLHYFFKTSWLGEFAKVPVFGPGTNVIPTIHVTDLAGVIQNVIDHKPKIHYFLAVDDSNNTFEDIVKIISFVLGPGKIKKVPKEEAYLTKVLTNADVDYLSVNLRIEPVFLKETFNLHWVSEAGIIDNINRVVEEYKLLRLLLPIRICLLGPPAVGKSSVAEKLCQHYKLHHINLKEVIDEKMQHLEEAVNGTEQEGESEEALSNAQDQLDSLKDSMEQNGGRLSDGLVYRIMRDKLNSTPCRNHGFVLDGFPKSYDQAKEIFYDEQDDPRSKMPAFNKKIIPEFIFSLEASDDFLKERVQNLPESVAEKMHYSKDEYLTRLKKFRKANVEDATVLNYFDELEIHPEHIEVNNAVDPEYGAVMDKITRLVGRPRNYGPTPEEREEMERKSVEETAQRLVLETAEWNRRETETAAKMATQLEEWNRHVTEVKRQEHELLEARSAPLRNYLMNYVMPSLTEGMMECCKAKPDDPVDFLAEYLLRNNSQD
ncbi:adenylate kinase 7a [Oncorhynchus tshawytscha]|uniref:Nucleoside-diphosphate kinase n=1 Tax=Oncorhynchus tshawytscha TaxID=74940 RepID=A0A8C8H6B6_ONCTS|nr:adenylate kinase 7a [Oncorhynchus tshawytscha]